MNANPIASRGGSRGGANDDHVLEAEENVLNNVANKK
jgi:hypothetical protein